MRYISFILILYSLDLSAQVTCQDNFHFSEDSLLFHDRDSIPFTGNYKDYYPGIIKTHGEYLNGLKNGKFINYSSSGDIISLETFSNGVKDGISEYYKTRFEQNILIGSEIFEKGKLISGYYWSISGQIERIYIYDSISSNSVFEIDSNILQIVPYLDIENTGQLKQSDFYSLNSIKVNVAKITCKNCFMESIEILDTVVLDDYKILSFSASTICHGSDYEFIFKNGYISKKAMNYFKNCDASVLYLQDIIISDNKNIIYKLPTAKYLMIKK